MFCSAQHQGARVGPRSPETSHDSYELQATTWPAICNLEGGWILHVLNWPRLDTPGLGGVCFLPEYGQPLCMTRMQPKILLVK